MEKWRDIPGYSAYQASNLGRVRSLDHEVLCKDGRVRLQKGRILKQAKASHGYKTVCLGRNNTQSVHVLVASAFIGPCPAGFEVRHLDGNPENNASDNLLYGSRADNIADAKKAGTWWTPERYGAHRPRDWHGRYT